jgi:hypothetical protein
MKRLAHHDNASTSLVVDGDDDARVGYSAHGGVNVDERGLDADSRRHRPSCLVATHGGEQVDLGVALAELRESDAATTAREDVHVHEVGDTARPNDTLDAPQRHVFDMANDGDAANGHGA